MRIAAVHNLPSGGGRRALVEHCRGLRALGHTIEVFSPDTADEAFLPFAPASDRVRLYPTPGPPGREPTLFGRLDPASVARAARLLQALRSTYRQIARDVDAGGFDVALVGNDMFTHSPFVLRDLRTPSAYYCGEPLRFVYDAPVGLDVAPQGRVWRIVRWAASGGIRAVLRPIDATNMRAAGTVLTNSIFTHEAILRAYGRSARVVYLGVDTDRFRPLERPRERFVLSIGAMHPAKGFDFVVRALALLPPSRRPRLVVVSDRGYGVFRLALEALARGLGVEVELRQRIPETELVELLNRAAAVTYAPYLEPFGFVPLEAMACATPVVAVAEGGVRESVQDGISGLLVPRDEHAFAAALGRILDDATFAARLGRTAREAVVERWTWAASCRELERALTGCLESPHP